MESKSESNEILFTIGPYQIYKSIGQGGMGEVFLAFDPRCGRRLALKRLRADWQGEKNLREYFLHEARLTGQMAHPNIVPIYDIVDEPESTYYTMPYIDGITLHQAIALGKEQEKEGLPPDMRTTLSTLLHAFISICHAVSYAHSIGVIHRDLKPSNIMIGRCGEVVILDWGVAKIVQDESEASTQAVIEKKMVDKVTGTVPYIAPEQAFGQKADYRTEIYTLGMILYEMMTLRQPFHRDNLESYRYNLAYEVLLDPAQVAPYRGITPILSMIVRKCLSPAHQERYQSIDEVLYDMENYIRRHDGWFKVDEVDAANSSAWESSLGNPLEDKLSTLSTCSKAAGVLFISKRALADLLKITLKVKLGAHASGIGLLLGISDAQTWPASRHGYCLWLASDECKNTEFFRLPDKEIPIEDLFLKREEWHELRVEKIDNTLSFYLNQRLQFTYVQHIPLCDTHIGIWLPGNEIQIQDHEVYIGGHAFNPNPLAPANILFAHGYCDEALHEYRQQALQFPFTFEGRKATFRAGVAQLEYAFNNSREGGGISAVLEASRQDFDKLSDPFSAPLALLGHALCFQYLQDDSGEIKCFETAFARYAQHSLIYVWHNQLLSRLLENSRFHRSVFCRFLLLAMRYLPEPLITPHLYRQLQGIKEISASFYFLNDQRAASWPVDLSRLATAIRLAFCLAAPDSLAGMIDDHLKLPVPNSNSVANALCALLELGAYEQVERKLDAVYKIMLDVQAMAQFDWIHKALLIHHQEAVKLTPALQSTLPHTLNKQSMRIVVHILCEALRRKQTDYIYESVDLIEKNHILSNEFKQMLMCCRIWAFLLDKKWTAAEEELSRHSQEFKSDFAPLSPSFLKGCWLAGARGKTAALHYFMDMLQINPQAIGGGFAHYIQNQLVVPADEISQATMWDRRQFYRQAALLFHCLGDEGMAVHFEELEQHQYV